VSPVELIPILSGLLLGALLGRMEPVSRKRIGLSAALAVSFLATILSGEYRVSWGFLVLDTVLVIAGSLVTLVTLHRVRCSRVER
jgi:hypothetical protein